MTSSEKKITFKIEFSRILKLLADQIYQSPLALLRENTQNAFDAIRMRQAECPQFNPSIYVNISKEEVVVSDNGVGMTPEEIEANFWYAGRSGKNTAAARAAGVVGTFGIGAMANFGVADELSVESQSVITGERTLSSVLKSELSTEVKAISITRKEPGSEPGTTVRARLAPGNELSVRDARSYLRGFVEFVDTPVYLNDERISGASHRTALPSERFAWSECHKNFSFGGILTGDLELRGMASGELRIVLENVKSDKGLGKPGAIVLVQGQNVIRTLRSGFGLANVTTQSRYRWGGIVDLQLLRPTAGREALDSSSNQLLQRIVSALDHPISQIAAKHPESFSNDGFLHWVVATKRYSLCGDLEIMLRPSGESESLSSVVDHRGLRYYSGRDQSVMQTYASDDEPLVVLSRRAPRRQCELGYLRSKGVKEVDVTPKVTNQIPTSGWKFSHAALAARLARILEEDYFLPVEIRFGSISGGLSLLVTRKKPPVEIYLNPASTSVAPLLAMYTEDFQSFSPFVKDFVRSAVFPRISRLVPSSTREGAEAFLRHLRSNREWFEYDLDDQANIEEILQELHAGRLSVVEASKRLTGMDRSYLEVSSSGTEPLSSVVKEIGDETQGEASPDLFESRPGIDRREEDTRARILTSEHPVNGYNCFLSLSDRVQRERGSFFLQPHSTNIVWGGRKVIFVFQHHSRRFGLYYDILCPGLVEASTGFGPRVTSTILTKSRTFIPVPDEIADTFLPKSNERIRLEVGCDILYLEEDGLLNS